MKGNLRTYLIRKIGGNFALSIIGLTVDLSGLTLVVRVVGKEGYGIAGLFMSMLSLIGFVEVGLGAFVTKSLSEHKGNLTRDEASRILSSGAYGLAGLALLTCLGVGIFSFFFFGHTFSIADEVNRHLWPSRILIVAILLEAFVITFFNRVLQGVHAFEKTRMSAIAIELLRFGLLLAFLRPSRATETNINLMLFLRFMTYMLSITSLIILTKRHLGAPFTLAFRYVERGQLRKSLAFSSPIIMSKLISRLQTIGGVWIVGAIIGPSGAAVLLLAQRAFQAMADMSGSLLTTIFPISSSLNAQNRGALEKFWENGTYYNMALTAVLTSLSTTVIGPLSRVFLKGDFRNLASLVFIYGIALFIGGIYGLGNEMLMGMDRHHRIFPHYLLSSAVSIVAQSTFSYFWGVAGIPAGVALGLAVFCILTVRLQTRNLEVTAAVLARPIAVNLAFAATILGLGFYVLPLQGVRTLPRLLLWGGLQAGITFLAAFILLTRQREKQLIFGFLSKRVPWGAR